MSKIIQHQWYVNCVFSGAWGRGALWRYWVGNKRGIERGEDKRQHRKGDEGRKGMEEGKVSRREDGKQEQDEKVKQDKNEKL